MRRIHARVRGRVQGVYYRASTRAQADALGIAGWVRNRDDGSVELVAEGDEVSLRELLLWCRKGPPHAKVEDIESQWADGTGEFAAFEILR